MERFVAPMATWEIVGGDLPPVRVRCPGRSMKHLQRQGFAIPAIVPDGSLRRAKR